MTEPRHIEFLKTAIDRPLVLIGMMGTGKSTLGRMLSKELGLQFYDSDKLLEEKAGMSVADIFEQFGEEKFRQSESSTIIDLMGCGPCVIATGGGAPVNDDTRAAMLERAVIIWLQAPAEVLFERVRHKQSRPLLQNADPLAVLSELLERRRVFYECAHFALDVSKGSLEAVCDQMIQALFVHLKNDNV